MIIALKQKQMDEFNGKWILDNSIEICAKYEHGELTIRGLHYQLVGRGMSNTNRHYKRVVSVMGKARRDGIISYYQFSDHDREMSLLTKHEDKNYGVEVEEAKEAIDTWMNSYYRNRWDGQTWMPEIWIEKKALIGAFKKICERNRVGLAACKGYPSLTFLNDAAARFSGCGKSPLIIYFGDYDPSGEDIPRSIQSNLYNDFDVSVTVERVALMEHQVIEMKLPPAPAKETDSRTKNWDGLGQVELDAVPPEILQDMTQAAINKYFDVVKHEQVQKWADNERINYREELKNYVRTL